MKTKEVAYIIYPTHRQRGYSAPGIAVNASSYSIAKAAAEKLSRLSDFPEIWMFI